MLGVVPRLIYDTTLSPGCTWDIFARTSNATLLFHVAVTVKLESCTCSQAQVLQQNRWDNVAEYSLN